MEVTIIGFAKEQAVILFDAALFFGKLLFHGNMRKRIVMAIQRNPQLELMAECWPEDHANRHFVIDIRDAEDDDDPVSTLAHEMCHMRQWARGDLSCTPLPIAKGGDELGVAFVEVWKGTIWKPGYGEHPYFDAPWEIEAYGKEVGMMSRWKDYLEKRT